MAEALICSKCSGPRESEALYCPFCGVVFGREPAAAPAPPPEPIPPSPSAASPAYQSALAPRPQPVAPPPVTPPPSVSSPLDPPEGTVSPPQPVTPPPGPPAVSRPSAPPENPYQAPETTVDRPETYDDPLANMVLARRVTRLAAQFVDGFIVAVPTVTLVFATMELNNIDGSENSTEAFMADFWIRFFIAAGPILLFNGYLLAQSGQTIGKKILGIKIVRYNGERATLGRILVMRYLGPGLIGYIPAIGFVFRLVNVLMIFGEERRCIHDYMADTKVVVA